MDSDSENDVTNFLQKKSTSKIEDEAHKRRMHYRKMVIAEEREKMLKYMNEQVVKTKIHEKD